MISSKIPKSWRFFMAMKNNRWRIPGWIITRIQQKKWLATREVQPASLDTLLKFQLGDNSGGPEFTTWWTDLKPLRFPKERTAIFFGVGGSFATQKKTCPGYWPLVTWLAQFWPLLTISPTQIFRSKFSRHQRRCSPVVGADPKASLLIVQFFIFHNSGSCMPYPSFHWVPP